MHRVPRLLFFLGGLAVSGGTGAARQHATGWGWGYGGDEEGKREEVGEGHASLLPLSHPPPPSSPPSSPPLGEHPTRLCTLPSSGLTTASPPTAPPPLSTRLALCHLQPPDGHSPLPSLPPDSQLNPHPSSWTMGSTPVAFTQMAPPPTSGAAARALLIHPQVPTSWAPAALSTRPLPSRLEGSPAQTPGQLWGPPALSPKGTPGPGENHPGPLAWSSRLHLTHIHRMPTTCRAVHVVPNAIPDSTGRRGLRPLRRPWALPSWASGRQEGEAGRRAEGRDGRLGRGTRQAPGGSQGLEGQAQGQPRGKF